MFVHSVILIIMFRITLRIVCIGRRNIDLPTDGGWEKVEQTVVDYDSLDNYANSFNNVDTAFCCLGTTRAKAGKAGFIKVDHDYVLNSAKLLKSANCPDFHLLTSRGANPHSWFLYPQTKGQVEEDCKQLGFERLTIYRPGLLLCDRAEQRGGEKFFRLVASWWQQPSSWSIPTTMVAAAMVSRSLSQVSSAVVLEHADIVKIVQEAKLD